MLIRLKTSNGKIRELDDVKHVPKLNINLISFRMLYKMRCLVNFESWTLKVPKWSIVLMKSGTSNGLYILKGTAVTGEVSVSNQS